MKEHILLDKAYIYENIDRDLSPKDCFYDRMLRTMESEQYRRSYDG